MMLNSSINKLCFSFRLATVVLIVVMAILHLEPKNSDLHERFFSKPQQLNPIGKTQECVTHCLFVRSAVNAVLTLVVKYRTGIISEDVLTPCSKRSRDTNWQPSCVRKYKPSLKETVLMLDIHTESHFLTSEKLHSSKTKKLLLFTEKRVVHFGTGT